MNMNRRVRKNQNLYPSFKENLSVITVKCCFVSTSSFTNIMSYTMSLNSYFRIIRTDQQLICENCPNVVVIYKKSEKKAFVKMSHT